MSSRHRTLAVLASVPVIAVVYTLCQRLHVHTLWYDARLGQWSLGARPSTVAINFFGYWGSALLAGAASLAVTLGATHRRAVSVLQVKAATLFAFAVLMACTVSMGVSIVNHRPTPEPWPWSGPSASIALAGPSATR